MNEHYDNPEVDILYNAIWGENIHYGVYESPADSIDKATRRAKQRMADAISLSSDSVVLETGCGYGSTARFLAETFGCRVVATNISEAQLERARQLTVGSESGQATGESGQATGTVGELITYEHADYHELPYDASSFDCYWCQESLVHAVDKPKVLSEAFRVLRPGGWLVVSDQIFRPDELTGEELRAVQARYGMEDISSPQDYAHMIDAAGFRLIINEDWQEHASEHRRRVRDRLAREYQALEKRISHATLAENYRSWDNWVRLAEEGKLTVGFYVGRKPR